MEIDTGFFPANTHVNDFFISMLLPLRSSFTPSQSIPGDFNDGSIELSFRVQCDPGFIGDNCTSMLAESNIKHLLSQSVCSIASKLGSTLHGLVDTKALCLWTSILQGLAYEQRIIPLLCWMHGKKSCYRPAPVMLIDNTFLS